MAQDIRWLQRFSNYCKALAKLGQAVDIVSWRLEFTRELVWKVMKDYAEYQGYTDIRGSRDAIRKALQIGLIEDKRWMETIEDRNLTSHNYDDDVASEIYENIVLVYYPLFCRFEERMLCISENETR